MNPTLLHVAAVILAYFVGAIPFAYLLVWWLKGIDIRTVGSGNVGATNAGRLLGFPFFVLIFALDVLKGLAPTLGFPRAVAALTGQAVPNWLPVLVALGTILGHNFPVYLRFRGGKGVATSLGAFAALDPLASLASFAGFLASMVVTRFVSISSVVGALFFFVVHFARAEDPWGQDLAMSVITIVLVGMLIVRHHKNFARLRAGTEPKISIGRRKSPPTGSIRLGLLMLVLLGLVGAGGWVYWNASRRQELDLGSNALTQVARISSGYQRASRVLFCDQGRLVALLCPRYCRLVLFRVTAEDQLELYRDLTLEGRPMAVASTADRLLVLQRPDSDRRHLEPGWVDTYDFQGARVGDRFLAGINPDDLAITPDGLTALIVTGEKLKRENQPPRRYLAVHNLAAHSVEPMAKLGLDRWEDQEARITLSSSGRAAIIALHATGIAVAVDLADPAQARLVDRTTMPDRTLAYPSRSEHDQILMPVASLNESIWIDQGSGAAQGAVVVIGAKPKASSLEARSFVGESERTLGVLKLRGPLNLGEVRPTALDWSAERRLLAVASKSGALHLLALKPKPTLVAQRDAVGSSRKYRTFRNSAPLP